MQNEIPNTVMGIISSSQSHLVFKLKSTLNYLITHANDVCFFLFASSHRQMPAGMDTQTFRRNLTCNSVLFSGIILAAQG